MTNPPHDEKAPYDPENAYELEVSGPVDWAQAIRELEESAPPRARKTPPPAAPMQHSPPAPAAAPQPVPAPAPAPEEDADLIGEFTGILMEVNNAANKLRRFEQQHPYLVAPNIFRVWEEGLRETSLMMAREFERLRDHEGFDEEERETIKEVPLDPNGFD